MRYLESLIDKDNMIAADAVAAKSVLPGIIVCDVPVKIIIIQSEGAVEKYKIYPVLEKIWLYCVRHFVKSMRRWLPISECSHLCDLEQN